MVAVRKSASRIWFLTTTLPLLVMMMYRKELCILQNMLKLEQGKGPKGGSTSNNSSLIDSPTLSYCIIQITSGNGRPATMFSIEKQDPLHAKFYLFQNNGSVTNDLMFRALRDSQFLDESTTICSWIFFGDDDTLFFPNNIHQFIRSRQHDPLIHPHTLKAVYGNLAFPYGKSYHSSPSTPTPVWFTGGAGMILTRASAQDALSRDATIEFETRVVNNTAFPGVNSSLSDMACGGGNNNECGDGPFCITLQLRGHRLFHQPYSFLDSCLDCNNLVVSTTASSNSLRACSSVLSCHAVSVYQRWNKYSKAKSHQQKNANLHYYMETRNGHYSYKQPDVFRNMTQRQRRDHLDQICSSSEL